MTAFSLRRRCLPIAAGLLSLFVASCKSTQKSKSGYADVVDYTSPNTGLSQEEYPFDKDGNYLADVVSGKTKGKPASSKPVETVTQSYVDTYEKPLITAVDTPPEKRNPIYDRVPEPEPSQPSYSSGGGSSSSSSTASSRTKTTTSSASASKPKPKPKSAGTTASRSSSSTKAKAKPVTTASKSKAKPKPASLTYTVKRGDTLYGLASRYGTSVAAIKQANGMSSSTLRDGRTLRIPRK